MPTPTGDRVGDRVSDRAGDKTGAKPRLAAAEVALSVFDHGQAADVAIESACANMEASKDRSLVRRLAHGLMRDWPMVNAHLKTLLHTPLKPKDRLSFFILAVAISELRDGREPDHAVVHCAVEATRLAKAEHLAKLVNAILRRFLREREALEAKWLGHPAMEWGYPQWLIDALAHDWPDEWVDLLAAGNASPPLTLRVNRRHWTREQALDALSKSGMVDRPLPGLADAVMCETRAAIRDVPEFMDGGWSVQDAGAQWAIDWLDLADGQRVLDACAGPGGKAAHCLERADIDLVAVESEPDRLAQVGAGLERLSLSAELICGDATAPDQWWDGQAFDRILIDAPCSATGVIRRHPDIRWLRQPQDIDALVTTQALLLNRLWPLLKPGGILVYVTCSVLARENHQQVQRFLENHSDAKVLDPPSQDESSHGTVPGRAVAVGWQVLPGQNDWDGFYYAALGRLPSA